MDCENVKFRIVAFVGSTVKRIVVDFSDWDSLLITLKALKSTYKVHCYCVTAKDGPVAMCLYESKDFSDFAENYD